MNKSKIPCTSRLRLPTPVVPQFRSRRSKSLSDLAHAVFSTSRIGTATKKVAVPTTSSTSSKTRLEPIPSTSRSIASKMSVKRPAANGNEAIKPKVLKPMKPAPYDYKARYNLLLEQHKTLKEKHGEADKRLAATAEELDSLRTNHQQLQDEHHILTEENQHLKVLEGINTALTHALEAVKTDHANLQKDYFKLQADHKQVQTGYTILQQDKLCVDSQLSSALETIKNLERKLKILTSSVQDHEKMRRQMHNQIQDLKGTIRVFCRVRPPLFAESTKLPCYITCPDEVTLEIGRNKENITSKTMELNFVFDKVFPPQASQVEVFEELSELVQSALDGYHVSVFAYGQTGSGKTYTMQGESDDARMGMVPRTIHLIFRVISLLQELGWKYTVEASFLEIYNECVRDLLDPHSKKQHEIRYNDGKGTSVTNLTSVTVSSAEELHRFMMTANGNRAVAVTNFNEHSSRSHAITKVALNGFNEGTQTAYTGSLSLVDLAGSENAKSSSAERITETKHINKSLSTLGSVMQALHRSDSHIPYRDSKLTYLLQSSLGGNSKTLLIFNIAPFEECFAESVNTLRFASMVKEVKTVSKKNKMRW